MSGAPEQALVHLLEGIEARIGSSSDFLNSLALIGQRMLGDCHSNDRAALYGHGHKPVAKPKRPAPVIRADVKAAADEIRRADQGKNLGARVMRDAKGLAELIDKHGAAAVVPIIISILPRFLIDGVKPGSWKYFDGAIAEELRLSDLQAERVRPGDLNWRRVTLDPA